MESVRWDDTYSIGDEEIDGHHQQLIAYIQILQDREQREKLGRDQIQKVVDGLVDYTDYHFRAEEARMRELEYPDYESHKRAHAAFINDITIFKDDYVRASPELGDRLLAYLTRWLLSHILNNDMHFGDFMVSREDEIRGIETGQSPIT
jgi:hemerythrin-like metal-binding protein